MSRTPVLFVVALLLLAPARVEAHSAQSASLEVGLDAEGRLRGELKTKAEPFFHALASETLTLAAYRERSAEAAWREALAAELTLAIEFSLDGKWVTPRVEVLPAGEDEWLRARYVFEAQKPAPAAVLLRNGESLDKLLVRVLQGGEPAGADVFLDGGQSSEELWLAQPQAPPGRASVALQYLVLGFEHILPKGLDHILFVLGLFLLSMKVKALLLQITAFTVAHTVTLGLCMFGVIQLPASVVEPLIALSIVYVAIENVVTDELKPWRPGVVFLFGLLHGLGFAGVLSELGVPRERFVTALLSFNVGVEVGQLCVVAIALALVWRVREREWYRQRVVIPASILIALIGLYWCVERTLL